MKKLVSILIILTVFFSCSTTSKVNSGKLFQKRKYQKGWYVNSTSKIKQTSKAGDSEVEIDKKNVESEDVAAAKSEEKEETTQKASVATEEVENEVTAVSEKIKEETLENRTETTSESNLQNEKDFVYTQFEESADELVNSKETIQNQTIEKYKAKSKSNSGLEAEWWMYVLCFFIPWLAVGLVTDWDVKTVVINILWTLLCGIPGIIHAFIVVNREG